MSVSQVNVLLAEQKYYVAVAATSQMLSWDTDLTSQEKKEYHRLHDKGHRHYQEYGPKTALLHLLMGQDSTTKRFIVIVSRRNHE